MCSEETIEKINNGKAIVLSKNTSIMIALITLVIVILVNAVAIGIWKGTVDEKFNAHIQSNIESFQRFEETGSKVAVDTQREVMVITHNLKRLMEAHHIAWEDLK